MRSGWKIRYFVDDNSLILYKLLMLTLVNLTSRNTKKKKNYLTFFLFDPIFVGEDFQVHTYFAAKVHAEVHQVRWWWLVLWAFCKVCPGKFKGFFFFFGNPCRPLKISAVSPALSLIGIKNSCHTSMIQIAN